jgi:hypothetical protein
MTQSFILTKQETIEPDRTGRSSKFVSYYLNGVLITKQRIPYTSEINDKSFEYISFSNEYLFNNRIYQIRTVKRGTLRPKFRKTSYRLSKWDKFNIPKNLKIHINENVAL